MRPPACYDRAPSRRRVVRASASDRLATVRRETAVQPVPPVETTNVDVIRKILQLLSARERRHAYLLVGLILVMGVLDAVGVASIMPFISVAANPDVVSDNHYLSAAYEGLGFTNPDAFLFFLGVLVFAALVLSIAFKAMTTWALLRYTHMREYSLGKRLVTAYLHQPYEAFLDRHSAEFGKVVLTEVHEVIRNALIPFMQLVAQAAVALALLVLLVVADPFLALCVTLGLGIGYGLIYLLLRQRLGRLGKERVEARQLLFKTLAEAFGGIKEVKISGLERIVAKRYEAPAHRYAQQVTTAQLAKQLPRYLLEILAFGGMLAVVLYLMRTAGGLQGALPIIGLYALASYRLMPAIQQVYAHLSTLRFAGPALDAIHADLMALGSPPAESEASRDAMKLERDIVLDGIVYAYPKSSRTVLQELSLIIPARATIGLVGTTGSGKTTTVDVLLGLLWPQSGQVRVDGVTITKANLRSWQRILGYVPQSIYLTDDSVASNIAFGVPVDQIDIGQVEHAARIANLHEFVMRELPRGYETVVGERGVRLSGGQRQRIGIARALYHRPQVLILDEATSALDNVTEQAVMEAVHNLHNEVTVIVIAHRLSTVQGCDHIFLLDKGQVAAQGTFGDLVARNPRFREMVQVASAA